MSSKVYIHRCTICDDQFITSRNDAILCSGRCRVRAHRIKNKICVQLEIPDEKALARLKVEVPEINQERVLTKLEASKIWLEAHPVKDPGPIVVKVITKKHNEKCQCWRCDGLNKTKV